jgi:hypothetical protein
MQTLHETGPIFNAACFTSAKKRGSPPCSWGIGVALAFLMSGCVRNTITSYPADWSARTAVSKKECPHIAGRYQDTGEIASGTPSSSCRAGRTRLRGEWRCETSLSRNVAEIGSGGWVELRQPDANTLMIVSSDPAVDVKVMHRSEGDFTCSARGLERRLHASLMSAGSNAPSSVPLAAFNGMGTLINMASAGSAGVRTLTRTFRTASDGALIMDVSESESGLVVLIPAHLKDETFVRWSRIEPPASAEAADTPSAHVARFLSTNDFWHHLRATDVDGVDLEESGGEGRPFALSPGNRWVQVKSIDHNFKQWRDFDTTYGFELEAVAGHAYRLGRHPAPCLPAGNIDAALESHLISHTQVSLVDKGPGRQERQFNVKALCISGLAINCGPSESPDIVLDGLACVRLEGAARGYYGRSAVAREHGE